MQGLACTLKIRIYEYLDGSLVEFQRRAGDAVAFFEIYRKAKALFGLDDLFDGGEFFKAPEKTVDLEAKDAIAPLLGLIESAKPGADVDLLAEVATALSAMAEEDRLVAKELRQSCGYEALQQQLTE